MFKSKTVLVVGAGASAEAGKHVSDFPIGRELVAQIAALTRLKDMGGVFQIANHDIQNTIRRASGSDDQRYEEFLLAAQFIEENVERFISIDRFIETHQHRPVVPELCKIAIAYLILKAEQISKLYVDPHQQRRFDFGAIDNTWYRDFAEALLDGVTWENRASSFQNVSIICFNYDRCIEQFFTHWLPSRFGIESQEATRILGQLEILRPYGGLGPITHQAFGANAGGERLITLSGQIKTFTEQLEDKKPLKDIRAKIASAETLVFLGFSFQDQNLELLQPVRPDDKPVKLTKSRIYGTSYKVSGPDNLQIKRKLDNVFGPAGSDLFPLTCQQLFSEYSISLRALPEPGKPGIRTASISHMHR